MRAGLLAPAQVLVLVLALALGLPACALGHELDLSVGDVIVLQAASAAQAISVGAQVVRFLRLGLEHIFTGYDHVAFVLGLLLLGGSLRSIAGVVTSFTAAHSVTLALATLGVVRIPGAIVEPLIAASIVYVAVENLRGLRAPHPAPSPAGRGLVEGWRGRWRVSFLFGLVHGFGFAGALAELDLPASALATALISFNTGVELGQAAIEALAFPLLSLLRRSPALAGVALRTGSVAIGLAGVVWLVERLPALRDLA
jgi:hypothetical protein